MSISGIPPIAALPLPPLSAPAAPAASTAAARPDFGAMVAQGLEKLQATQATSDNLAVKATTGNLTDIHDYMIAANEATVATQLTVAVRNKAVEAFTEIMRMQM
jgi:flagellar hook-basal body complex protein FliE